ncbi:autotransporter-associated beta strand repeat-containing protein, partial [bacterium]|nr:autotransporter-associated beta strand repeat-containing protein [bacterium]
PAGDTVFMGPVTSVNGELISTSRNYVHKLDFGNGTGATVNGVVFDGMEATSGTGWSLSGADGTYWGDSGSGYSQLVSDFRLDADANDAIPACLTFSNLAVGTKYEAVIYSAPSWGSRIQNATFSNGTEVVVLRDTQPAFTGYYVYRFTAQTASVSITMAVVEWNAGYHWYGATLEDLSTVVPGSRTATLTVGDANVYAFGGVISGDLTLVKQGSGTQALGGANTYSGATIISNGTLKMDFPLVTPVDATALDSYTPDGRLPIHTIDGAGMSPNDPVLYSSTAGNSPQNAMWLTPYTAQSWITFDLGSVQTIRGLRLWNYNEVNELARGIKEAGVYTGTSLLANGSPYSAAGPAWGTLVKNMTFDKADGTAAFAGKD